MKKEVWKSIKDFEGLYEISSIGRIRSLFRIIEYKNGIKHPHDGFMLKQELSKDGYMRIKLWKSHKYKHFNVHRLVASAFIDNPGGKDCVNHIDSMRVNNCVYNLEWVTVQENTDHAIEYGNFNPKGEGNGSAKLKDNEVLEIRYNGKPPKEMMEKFSISKGVVSSIRTRRTWKHLI